jgi:hypothetical protein
VPTQESIAPPVFHRVRGDFELFGDFMHGELSCGAQAIATRVEVIIFGNVRHDNPSKRQVFS